MDIIKSSDEISHLFKSGKRFSTPYFTLIVATDEKQPDQIGRAAFVAGKRKGNAVWRNRAKRRLRGICQVTDGPYNGFDVIFVANRRINDASYDDLVASCKYVLKKAKIRQA